MKHCEFRKKTNKKNMLFSGLHFEFNNVVFFKMKKKKNLCCCERDITKANDMHVNMNHVHVAYTQLSLTGKQKQLSSVVSIFEFVSVSRKSI